MWEMFGDERRRLLAPASAGESVKGERSESRCWSSAAAALTSLQGGPTRADRLCLRWCPRCSLLSLLRSADYCHRVCKLHRCGCNWRTRTEGLRIEHGSGRRCAARHPAATTASCSAAAHKCLESASTNAEYNSDTVGLLRCGPSGGINDVMRCVSWPLPSQCALPGW